MPLAPARLALIASSVVLAAGCTAVVENRVESALTRAGVPAAPAACMAAIWAERLSVAQLQRVQRFATDIRAEGRQLTLLGLIGHVRSWNDPQAMLVVTTSAARCAFS
jgi:hypothetical protein